METLKVYRGHELCAQVVLGERAVELGRGLGCDIVVDDPDLAERHWLAMQRGGTVVAYDISSGARARARHLPLGERIALGRHYSWVREHHADTQNVTRDTEGLGMTVRMARSLLCVITSGPGDARKICIGDEPMSVGRAANCDLVLQDLAASLHHCRLEPCAEGLLVRDLSSRNGTFVNGVRVERALVVSDAHIRIGRSDLHIFDRDAQERVTGTGLVVASTAMLAVMAEAQRAATLPWPALVVGESGSGKEGIAALLHSHGPRRTKPLVIVNAGAVPSELIESELFGHERGAFTGALNARRGVFEQADGGTLFLDEIGELPLSLQARLLRVLETGEVRRVGAEGSRTVDVRVVCATHRDLRSLVANGMFRQDLYFRIARVVLEVPPLRTRPEDLRALSRHFLAELATVVGPRTLTSQAMERLSRHSWPGNVRELRSVLSAAVLASTAQRVEAGDVERALARLGGNPAARGCSEDELREAFERHSGNTTAMARTLGVPRSTLRGRLRQLGLGTAPADAP